MCLQRPQPHLTHMPMSPVNPHVSLQWPFLVHLFLAVLSHLWSSHCLFLFPMIALSLWRRFVNCIIDGYVTLGPACWTA